MYNCLAALLKKTWEGIWRFESVCIYSFGAICDHASLLCGLWFGWKEEERLYHILLLAAQLA
jgi:hypothetical protein